MNLGLKEAMSILDLWQALEPVFSGSGGSSAGAVAGAGGSATTKRPGSSAGRDPGRKKIRRHHLHSQYQFWLTKIIKAQLLSWKRGIQQSLLTFREHTGSICIG